MLKQTYVRIAQPMFGCLIGDKCIASIARTPHGWRRWFASLGAIYNLDRMIALDIPWWNVAATTTVEDFLHRKPNASVFEYGSGASTIWLARRTAGVYSVEHNTDWQVRLAAKAADYPHVMLMNASYNPTGEPDQQPYVRAIDTTGQHDLIVIDGRLRAACLKAAIAHLKPGGILLFDDSGRRRYRAAIEQCGLSERQLRGLSYCVPYPDSTSILKHSVKS